MPRAEIPQTEAAGTPRAGCAGRTGEGKDTRQPLLPRKLSQLGPGVAWCDIDGDGWEDLVIGSGYGGKMAVFRNDGRGGFEPWDKAPFDQPVNRDQTTILSWRKGDGQVVLLAGSSNYEDAQSGGSCAREFNLATKTIEPSVATRSRT